MTETFQIIAVDGGAASGKSSTSRAVSKKLGLLYVDTGSHYRMLTLALLRKGINFEDPYQLRQGLDSIRIGTEIEDLQAHITIDGKRAGKEIRSPEVNKHVSQVAAQPPVRQFLLEYQRSQAGLAKEKEFNGLIMEGRDIGSVIFPDAQLRFFLFADEAERAKRRALEGQEDSIRERDLRDQKRATAPLTCPQGAIKIDSTHMTLEEVVEEICRIISEA